MTFSEAIEKILTGLKLTRAAWIGGIVWVAYFTEYAWNEEIYPRTPQIQQMDVNGSLTPWLPNQQDLEADDWSVVVDE